MVRVSSPILPRRGPCLPSPLILHYRDRLRNTTHCDWTAGGGGKSAGSVAQKDGDIVAARIRRGDVQLPSPFDRLPQWTAETIPPRWSPPAVKPPDPLPSRIVTSLPLVAIASPVSIAVGIILAISSGGGFRSRGKGDGRSRRESSRTVAQQQCQVAAPMVRCDDIRQRVGVEITATAGNRTNAGRKNAFQAAVNPPVPSPSRTVTVLSPELAATISSLPSPLRSPVATDCGLDPVANGAAAADDPLPIRRREGPSRCCLRRWP